MAETCYRHPRRETNVSCSRCGRPICPECMNPSPVGMRCPECAGERTRVQRPRGVSGASGVAPYATYGLIALNAIVYLASLGGGGTGFQGGGTLITEGGLFGPAVADGGEWWRIVTSGFLHAGALHVLLNMFVLYILGSILEPAIGTARLLGIYFVSLLAGSFGALLLTPDTLTVGASGAVYGLLAATFLIARDRGSEQLASMIGIWLVINLVFTFSIPRISVGGHLGGLAGGAIAALLLIAVERRLRGRQAGLIEGAGMVALGAVAFAVALAVAGNGGGALA